MALWCRNRVWLCATTGMRLRSCWTPGGFRHGPVCMWQQFLDKEDKMVFTYISKNCCHMQTGPLAGALAEL